MQPQNRDGVTVIGSLGLAIGVLFSVMYLSLCTLLVGGGNIYWYPYWTPGMAAAYAVFGSLIQGGFCYRLARNATWGTLGGQILTGLGYLAATLLTGSLYMS